MAISGVINSGFLNTLGAHAHAPFIAAFLHSFSTKSSKAHIIHQAEKHWLIDQKDANNPSNIPNV